MICIAILAFAGKSKRLRRAAQSASQQALRQNAARQFATCDSASHFLAAAPYGTLGADGRLDDLVLAPAAVGRRDRNPQPGDYVELRGRLDSGGAVVPQRMRRR